MKHFVKPSSLACLHFLHVTVPVSFAYVRKGHSGQLGEAVVLAYDPALHSMHSVEFRFGWNVPVGHASHRP